MQKIKENPTKSRLSGYLTLAILARFMPKLHIVKEPNFVCQGASTPLAKSTFKSTS
jgi:hypothetical protein